MREAGKWSCSWQKENKNKREHVSHRDAHREDTGETQSVKKERVGINVNQLCRPRSPGKDFPAAGDTRRYPSKQSREWRTESACACHQNTAGAKSCCHAWATTTGALAPGDIFSLLVVAASARTSAGKRARRSDKQPEGLHEKRPTFVRRSSGSSDRGGGRKRGRRESSSRSLQFHPLLVYRGSRRAQFVAWAYLEHGLGAGRGDDPH